MATLSSILPGEFHGLYSPQSRKELDVTERLSLSLDLMCKVTPLFLSPNTSLFLYYM